MDNPTPLDQDNQLLYAFLHRKKTRDNNAAMTAQRLVNLFRQIASFKPEFVHEYNQMLLNAGDEIQMMLQDIVGGPTVRQYLTYLQQAYGQASNEASGTMEKQSALSMNVGYLPSADEDTPFYKTALGFGEAAPKQSTESIVTIQDFTKWQKSQETLIRKAMMAQNKAISKLALALSEKKNKTPDNNTYVSPEPRQPYAPMQQFVNQPVNNYPSLQSDLTQFDSNEENKLPVQENIVNQGNLTEEPVISSNEEQSAFEPVNSFETPVAPEEPLAPVEPIESFETPSAPVETTESFEPVNAFEAPVAPEESMAPVESIESFEAPSAPVEPTESFESVNAFEAPVAPEESLAPVESIESFEAPSAPVEPTESFEPVNAFEAPVAPEESMAPVEPIESFEAPSAPVDTTESFESVNAFEAPVAPEESMASVEPIESFEAPNAPVDTTESFESVNAFEAPVAPEESLAPVEPIESFQSGNESTNIPEIIPELSFEAPSLNQNNVNTPTAPIGTMPKSPENRQPMPSVSTTDLPPAPSNHLNQPMPHLNAPAMPPMSSFKNLSATAPKPSAFGNFFKMPKIPAFRPMSVAKPSNISEGVRSSEKPDGTEYTSEIDNKGGN